jgi:3-dehydroquinate synthase class II
LVINGEKVEKVVARITFEGDNVVLTFSDQTVQTADMENVVLSFTPEDLTAIGTIKNAVNKTFSIEGLEPGTEIIIYNTDGKQVLTARASEDLTTLKMSSLKKGVYLMKAGKQVVKFIKR